jgi:hypothetical protein
MSIRDDFKLYIDGNNLLAPNPVGLNPGRASDNGPMYTSEYFVMLEKLNLTCPADLADYDHRISTCVTNEMLNRAPNDTDQEGPDDYYGVMNGCMELGNTKWPRMFLWSLIKHFGFLNNNSPGKMTGSSFMARQPQLVTAMIAAAFPSLKNPLHWLVRLAASPLFLITAIILGLSCIDTATDNTDARRLAWHLGNNVSKVSLLNWIAYKIWLTRLKKAYPNEMNGVAAIYYQPQGNNPYAKWWVT